MEWEQRQVKITILGLMLLPIRPVGILPNFQSSQTETHTQKGLCCMSSLTMARENHGYVSFFALFPAGGRLSSPCPGARHCTGCRHAEGDDQTHSITSPLLQAQLLHTELGKVFSRNGLSAQTVSHQLKLKCKWFWGGYRKC